MSRSRTEILRYQDVVARETELHNITSLVRGRLENQIHRDSMIGLCTGMRKPRCYDEISDRLNRRAMGID